MILEMRVAALRATIEDTVVPRDSQWAYFRCKDTLEIFDLVSVELPTPAYVLQEIVPLLEEVRRAVLGVQRTGPYADLVEKFASNIEERARFLSELQVGSPA
jgi:hypothetical protein